MHSQTFDEIDWSAPRQRCPAVQCREHRGKSVGIKTGDEGAPFAFCFRCRSTWRRSGRTRVRINAHASATAPRIAQDEARRHADAAALARRVWSEATPVQDMEPAAADDYGLHPYLERKLCRAHGTRVDSAGWLLVPIHIDGELVNLQRIAPDGTKRFLSGGRTGGATYLIDDASLDDSMVYVCEGFATAATVAEARGVPVFVAFSAGNLREACTAARRRYMHAAILIAGDNDEKPDRPTDIGLEKARDAAQHIGAAYVTPAQSGFDFNDLRVKRGWSVVMQALEAAEHAVAQCR